MNTDLFSKMRAAFGWIGDVNTARIKPVPPQRPPEVETFGSGDDEAARRVFDRIEYLMTLQERGRMKRLINARKDISNHLGLDHYFVMSIVREVCNPKAYRAAPKRFDRESREG
jgi:hypothetical protein